MDKIKTQKEREERLSDKIIEILDFHFRDYLADKPNKKKTVKGLIKTLVLEEKRKALSQKEEEVRREVVDELFNAGLTELGGKRLINTQPLYERLLEMRNDLKPNDK